MEASPENLIKAYGCRHRRLTLATPDAGLILSDGKREHAELDMGNRNPLLMYLPIVIKPGTSTSERQTNSESEASGKAASTMHRIMNDDPRRRFVFGPAFDNDIVRLYFASRTMASVSTPFEMYKDWRILVRIFVALGTARDRTDLGYDDTISVAQDERSYRIFDVSVDNAMFRIINCLSDGSSDATRVWVVRAVREGNAVGPCLDSRITGHHIQGDQSMKTYKG
ncbi:other 1 protein kinase [Moniliophthora roreri MCA 2997]|uniref:Other 1 protein kinase n=1 Tax=Moniliophthora roreri (strain MCA 2997) TaxID=1381753 RepID=V2Y0G6_MONRO|nr:other 1 protein kinase [Moniliophthora roreri MCA 2997]